LNRFFPYETLADTVFLVAETQSVDGVQPPYDLLAARQSIDLSALTPPWRRVTVRMRVDLPSLGIRTDISETRVVLSLNCPSTNLRIGYPMVPGARLGSYVTDVEIEAGALAKRAELRAIVSGTVDGVANRYVGESDKWNIWISAPEVPLLTGDLPVRWVNFVGDDAPATLDPAFRSQAYYVDVTNDPPIIYLNDNFQDLRRLFDDAPRRSTTEKALREAHFHSIALGGWLAMFNASLGGLIRQDDGTLESPDTEWQSQVLRTVLPKVYPDLSPEDSMLRAYEDNASPHGSRLLQSRAFAAINGMLSATARLRSSIRAMEESL